MAQKKKTYHKWTKAQPHHVTSGRITTKKFADKNPRKVEWVTGKK